MKRFLCVLAVVAVFGVLGSPAMAVNFYLANDGFEAPDLTSTAGGIGSGWFYSANIVQEINGGPYAMTNATNGNHGADGSVILTSTHGQAAAIQASASGTSLDAGAEYIAQNLTGLPAGTWQASLDIEDRLGYAASVEVYIRDVSVFTGSGPGQTLLGTYSAASSTSFNTVVTPSFDTNGTDLYRLYIVSTTAPAMTFVDNVHLTGTLAATPEPGTIVLVTTGLIGLLCYAWRKQK
jgi:hypothetical protein